MVIVLLAEAATTGVEDKALEGLVTHLWDVRHRVRGLTPGRCEPIVSQLLARLIEDRLSALVQCRDVTLTVPKQLAAAQLAGGQLGLVRAWLHGPAGCGSGAIVEALQQTRNCVLRPSLVNPTRRGSS
jgi:hypothetical protein